MFPAGKRRKEGASDVNYSLTVTIFPLTVTTHAVKTLADKVGQMAAGHTLVKHTSSLTDLVQPAEPPTYLFIQMQLCRKDSLREWLKSTHNRERSTIMHFFEQVGNTHLEDCRVELSSSLPLSSDAGCGAVCSP